MQACRRAFLVEGRPLFSSFSCCFWETATREDLPVGLVRALGHHPRSVRPRAANASRRRAQGRSHRSFPEYARGPCYQRRSTKSIDRGFPVPLRVASRQISGSPRSRAGAPRDTQGVPSARVVTCMCYHHDAGFDAWGASVNLATEQPLIEAESNWFRLHRACKACSAGRLTRSS